VSATFLLSGDVTIQLVLTETPEKSTDAADSQPEVPPRLERRIVLAAQNELDGANATLLPPESKDLTKRSREGSIHAHLVHTCLQYIARHC